MTKLHKMSAAFFINRSLSIDGYFTYFVESHFNTGVELVEKLWINFVEVGEDYKQKLSNS